MISFRPMSQADLDFVLEIEKKSFVNPVSKNKLIKEIDYNRLARYYIMLLDDVIIGYFGMWIISDEGHILNIAIDPNYRGKGYGNTLLKELISIAKENSVCKLTLEVRENNETAKNLYKKYNFKALGRRKDYYKEPKEDALIMWLDLGEENDINNTSDRNIM